MAQSVCGLCVHNTAPVFVTSNNSSKKTRCFYQRILWESVGQGLVGLALAGGSGTAYYQMFMLCSYYIMAGLSG